MRACAHRGNIHALQAHAVLQDELKAVRARERGRIQPRHERHGQVCRLQVLRYLISPAAHHLREGRAMPLSPDTLCGLSS